MNVLTEPEKAYLAGIIDGEGSISLVRHKGPRCGLHNLDAVVKVTNTDSVLIGWLREKTGVGSIYHRSRAGSRYRDVYTIVWATTAVRDILEAVLPYLVIKRDRAEIVLSLDRTNSEARSIYGGRFGSGRPVPEWLREVRLRAFDEMAELNRCGRPDASG